MISEIIEEWIKGILIDGITGNLSGLFDNVNAKVGEIAADVGATPQAWNSGIFNMLQNLSETVVLPIAAAILACVMCMELIQMINFGVGLAMQGKKVLLIDADPQGDLTTCLGWQNTDNLGITLATKLTDVLNETMNDPTVGILHHDEGVDLVPANLELSAMEFNLVNAMSRETALRNYLSEVKDKYDYTPTTIDTFYTDANGQLVTPEKLEYGKGYSLVEVQAPYGYVLDSTPVYFDVAEEHSSDEGGITVIKVDKPNMAQKGTVSIEKTGEVFSGVNISGEENADVIYQPVYEVKGLAGAVYEITAAEDIITPDGTLRYAKGEVVDTVTTDENGLAKSKELYLGRYTVVEITAPEGMVINKEAHEVELTYAGQEVAVTETATSFVNERQKVTVSLEKAIEKNDIFNIGNGDEVKNISFGLFAAEELVSTSGTSIPADGLIEIISLSENGKAVIKTDLPFGSYYVKELATDEHYILSDSKYPFTFSYAGQDTETVEIAVNDGKPIENKLIYGSVSGKKITENGEALGGAVIGLFKADETEFTKENALMTATSQKDGSFSFEKVPYGNWLVREIEQPEGFVLDETSYEVKISEVAQVIEVEIVNEYVHGNIKLTKVDEDYPDNKLTGATFEVYKDVNGDGKLDDGDELIGTLNETSTGIYEMKEFLYGKYLVRETKAPEGFELDKGVYSVFIEKDEMTYEVENKAGVGFINTAMKGNLKIVKTSSDGKVEGFTFRVTGVNGYDRSFTTDKNGEIIIEGLRIGDYTVSEVQDMALNWSLRW